MMYGKETGGEVELFEIKAKIQGASHFVSNTPCQDFYNTYELENGIKVIAVADGHGSKSCLYSKNGAEIATNSFYSIIYSIYKAAKFDNEKFIQMLRSGDYINIPKAITEEWNKRINDSYDSIVSTNKKKKKIDREEIPEFSKELFGTTLMGLVVADGFIYAIQFGDGDMVCVDNDGVYNIIDSDKFLGTETYSLSNENAWKYAKECFQRIEFETMIPFMFVVTTDGFINSFVDDAQYKISCTDYLNTIKQYGPEAVQENLENWLKETSEQGCGDDITFVAIGVI